MTFNGYAATLHPGAKNVAGDEVHRTLAREGLVVFCYDQIGFGRRIDESENFYQRHPHRSLLGKMVRDAQAAVDVVTTLPYVDADQVWCLGYSLRAFAGLHLGAVDDRLAGLISVCGAPPFRFDTVEKGAGGMSRWSHLHLLLPRLGFFIGEEERLPYDIDLLLASFAPRPLLVVSPQLDREAPLDDVSQAVEAARRVYAVRGAAEQLEQIASEDYNRFGPEIQAVVVRWLTGRLCK